jgi:hypothetical protein
MVHGRLRLVSASYWGSRFDGVGQSEPTPGGLAAHVQRPAGALVVAAASVLTNPHECRRLALVMLLHVDYTLITPSPHDLRGVHDDPHNRSPAMFVAAGYVGDMLKGGGPEVCGHQLLQE